MTGMGATAREATGAAARRYLTVAEIQPVAAVLATNWRDRPPALKRYPPARALSLVRGGGVLGDVLRRSYGLVRYGWDSGSVLPMPTGVRGAAAGRPHRPVASGGGLYPSEIYVVGAGGVFHYDPAAHALDPIRPADHRDSVPGGADILLVVTTIFARTVFKYGEFGFRLQCLDGGVLLGQLLTMLDVHGLAATVHHRFDDAAVADRLGVDPEAEAPLALVAVRGDLRSPVSDGATGTLPLPVALATARTTADAVLDSVPLTRALCRSARDDTGAGAPEPLDVPVRADVALPDVDVALLDGLPRRKSMEGRFGTAPLTQEQLAGVLLSPWRWLDGPPAGAGLERVLLCCVVHKVDGLRAGVYLYEPAGHRLALLRAGDLRVALAPSRAEEVRVLGDHGAGAVLVPLGDYRNGFDRVGDRWFQMQNLPVGLIAQRTALAAAALGLGCRTLCSYDTDRLAATLGLDGGLRPLCQVLVGSIGAGVGYDQDL